MNPKISKLNAERAKNDGKIAMLQSRNREIDEDIIKLENEDIGQITSGIFSTTLTIPILMGMMSSTPRYSSETLQKPASPICS